MIKRKLGGGSKMNDEIKEILDKINNVVNHKEASYNALVETKAEDYKLLLDYITNLQQENDMLKQGVKDTYDTSQEMLAEKQQEIERLKAQLYGCDELLENDTRTIEDYKSRLDKAIEYINEHIRIDAEYPSYMEMHVEERDNLLNILQNGSEE